MFKRADQNKNNYLETSEIPFMGQGLDSRDFEAMDRDHNGMVFEDEWIVYLRAAGRAGGRAAVADDFGGVGRPAHAVRRQPRRPAQRAELATALAAVAAWAAMITASSRRMKFPGRSWYISHRPDAVRFPPSPRYSRMKASSKPQPASDAPVWFQKMDRNQDGEVRCASFSGPFPSSATSNQRRRPARCSRGAGSPKVAARGTGSRNAAERTLEMTLDLG